MSFTVLAMLIAGGAVAGFVNTLAGGGSYLTLPLLLLAGLDAPTANGTNRLAILLQSGLATWRFHRAGSIDWRAASWLVLPTLLGAVLGAKLATEVPAPVLRTTIGLVLVLAVPTLFVPEGRLTRPGAGSRSRFLLWALLFACGFYGGFLQAGVGIAMLAVLVPIAGLDLVRANGVKNLAVFVFTIAALAIFVRQGQVVWGHGLALGVGNMLGAFVATRFALRRGARAVRWVVALAIVLAGLALLGVFPGL